MAKHHSLKQNASQWFLLMFFTSVAFLMGIGIDLYVPSLPAITSSFRADPRAVKLTVVVYMLGYAVGQLLFGILSDRYGRRKILLPGGIVYTTVALLSIWAPNVYWLIGYRLTQGLAIAAIGVVMRAIAADLFAKKGLHKVMSFISTSWALGPIIGPVIGAYLQHYFNWQANFCFFGGYGLLVTLYAFLFIRETHRHKLSLSPAKIYWAAHKMLSHPVFVLSSLANGLVYSVLIIFNILSPFMIQSVLGYSTVTYGHIAFVLGCMFFIGNLVNRILLTWFKSQSIVLSCIILALTISTLMLFAAWSLPMTLALLCIPTACIFLLCAGIFSNLSAQALSLFPKSGGMANALFGLIVALLPYLIGSACSAKHIVNLAPLAGIDAGIFLLALIFFVAAMHCRKCSQRQDSNIIC